MPASSARDHICVFACRWCALLGAERAGRERLQLPAGIRLMPVPCAGGVSTDMVIQALLNGAAGVAVMGCHLGGCRHNDANRDAHARLMVLGDLLESLGIDRRRLLVSWGTAHEAAQYAKVMNRFASELANLPPMPALAPASEKRVDGVTVARLAASDGEDEALRASAAKAIAEGCAVLGLRRTDMGAEPALFFDEADLANLTSGPKHPIAKCAGQILHDKAAGKVCGQHNRALREQALTLGGRKIAIACRACDARALHEQASLRQFAREELNLLPLPCSKEQVAACACTRPLWPDAEKQQQCDQPASSVQTADLAANAAHWQQAFAKCVQCHWCREACPVCVCPSCSVDASPMLPAGMQPPSPLGYHLSRAMHVADICVQCGACEDACPQGLPLMELHRAVAASLKKLGHASGLAATSPLRAERHRANDGHLATPAWLHSLGGK